jgi:glycosyltransferase involved in cell wall biosynthesis
LFAKTHWIINEVKRHHGVAVKKVQPSIDHDVYKPTRREQDNRIHLVAMIRPQTPRRGADRTMRLFKKLHRIFGETIAIEIFGCESDSDEFIKLDRDFPFVNHGILLRPQVSNLLARSDLFIDLSDYQAFGRTALEAMACGCASVVPIAGGANEYAVDNSNAIIVDTLDEIQCYEKISKVIKYPLELIKIKRAGLLTASSYSVHNAAVSEALVIAGALEEWRNKNSLLLERPKLMIIPGLSSDQKMITGSWYVRVMLPYLSPTVVRETNVVIGKSLPSLGEANIVLLQRDAGNLTIHDLKFWLSEWKSANGRLIYEIDDDLLDEGHLKARGFNKCVSDVVEKVHFLIRSADMVHVSTNSLAERIKSMNSNVYVIPNALDASMWKLRFPRQHDGGLYGRPPNGPIRIGYIGTPSHQADMNLVKDALNAVEKKYSGKVEVEVIGAFQNITPFFGKRVGLPKKHDYPNFVKWLFERVHWDIGIIPLVDDSFNRSKSYLKFLEFAALDMALLVSDVPCYRTIAKHNQNCLLASATTEDWIEKLSQLIEDKILRQRLAENARRECALNHTLDKVAPLILKNINHLVSQQVSQ